MHALSKPRMAFALVSALFVVLLFVTVALLLRARSHSPLRILGVTRHYWIAAVGEKWAVSPTGIDAMSGKRIDAGAPRYDAVIYRPYAPDWAYPLPDPYGGMPGPTLFAHPGDLLIIHFKNLDTVLGRPHSMHAHGVHFTPDHDGTYFAASVEPGSAVPVGGSYVYEWRVGDDSIGPWVYHDHSVDAMDNTTRGMYGNILVTDAAEKEPDRRFFVFFNELMGHFTGAGEFDTINGRAFLGNTPTYHAKVGQTVEFVVSALGSGFHAFHIHAHRWKEQGEWKDVLTVGPSESKRFTMSEDAAGKWLLHCHLDMHMMGGMTALYEVEP